MSRNVFQVYASALKKWRKKTLNLIIDSLLQIVFPTRCPGCDKVLAVGERGFAADVQSSFIFAGAFVPLLWKTDRSGSDVLRRL